jgi:hypothetical protein
MIDQAACAHLFGTAPCCWDSIYWWQLEHIGQWNAELEAGRLYGGSLPLGRHHRLFGGRGRDRTITERLPALFDKLRIGGGCQRAGQGQQNVASRGRLGRPQHRQQHLKDLL